MGVDLLKYKGNWISRKQDPVSSATTSQSVSQFRARNTSSLSKARATKIIKSCHRANTVSLSSDEQENACTVVVHNLFELARGVRPREGEPLMNSSVSDEY